MRNILNAAACASFVVVGISQYCLTQPSAFGWHTVPFDEWGHYAGAIGPFQSCPGRDSPCPKAAVRGPNVTCKTVKYTSNYGAFHFKCLMLVDAGYSRHGCSSGDDEEFRDCKWNLLFSCHGPIRGPATEKCGVYEVSKCEKDHANRCRGTVWTRRSREFCRRDCNRTKAMVPEVGPQ